MYINHTALFTASLKFFYLINLAGKKKNLCVCIFPKNQYSIPLNNPTTVHILLNNISNIFDFSKEITNHYFRVCIKDDAGYDGPRGIVVVKYLVIGGKGHYNELNLLN